MDPPTKANPTLQMDQTTLMGKSLEPEPAPSSSSKASSKLTKKSEHGARKQKSASTAKVMRRKKKQQAPAASVVVATSDPQLPVQKPASAPIAPTQYMDLV